jgi:alkanesulfonate monooxygenase SsuD/methylene tetrahydromethanopterin reductase-like flavin-dependent oxidoreductase (luciferase family)
MKVGVLLPSRFEDPGEFLADARAMEAAGADSIWMEEGDGHDPMLVLAAVAAVTGRLRLGLIRGSTPRPNVELDRRMDTLQHLSRQRIIVLIPSPARGGGSGWGLSGAEHWQRVEAPADRHAWAKTLQEAQPDFDGVIVPLDPRLLDILRHPEDAIDRSDLQLAQG